MKKHIITLVAALALAASGFGQVVITTNGQVYTQDFDTLATSGTTNSWTNNSTLVGWYANFANTGTPTVYIASAGTTTTGALYSFGTGTSTERAFGSVSSGTPGNITYGLTFLNSSGATLDSLSISYDGEQWRNGNNTTPQSITFEYSIDATSLTTGNWMAIPSLTFTSPIATATAGGLDGNALANRVAGISVVLSSLNVSSGSSLWLRITDLNDASNDHGLAIDNFSATAGVTAIPEPSTYAVIMGVATLAFIVWRRRQKA